MTTLLLLCILTIGYAACWILRLQHRIRIVSNGRLEATAGKYRALRDFASLSQLLARVSHRNCELHKHLKAREVRIYELWAENNKLKDDLAFQLRMGHLAGQLCECKGHLSPPVNLNS